jgi:predicted DNA-binding transcriptional regulator YafY
MRGQVAERQLRLLALLEGRPQGIAPDEAAEELGARRRTVYRDFEVLQSAGFPLVNDHEGKRARWRMMPGHRHRLQLWLSWPELLALMTARKAIAGLAGTLLHDGAASALEKIRATLPKGLADRFRASEGLVSAQKGGRDYGARREIVRQIVEAIEERRTIDARYRSRGAARPSERRLDPYHVRVAEEGIYVLARCHRSGEVKIFLADRFDSVQMTSDSFTVPADFQPEQVLSPAFSMWSGKARDVRFVVAPHLAHLAMERKAHPSAIAQRHGDGSVEVRLKVAIGPPLIGYLTGLGGAVSGIEPRELREAVRREHQQALTASESRLR